MPLLSTKKAINLSGKGQSKRLSLHRQGDQTGGYLQTLAYIRPWPVRDACHS